MACTIRKTRKFSVCFDVHEAVGCYEAKVTSINGISVDGRDDDLSITRTGATLGDVLQESLLAALARNVGVARK